MMSSSSCPEFAPLRAQGSNGRVFALTAGAQFLLEKMDRLFRPESCTYTRLVFLMVVLGRLCNDVPCRTAVVQGFWPGSAAPAPPSSAHYSPRICINYVSTASV